MYFTYRDAVDHLIDVFSLKGKDEGEVSRKLRRAVQDCCNKLPTLHDWEFLQRMATFTTSAIYTTGTIAYESSTREMTLTSGTWPSDADYGAVTIGIKKYEVQRRVSDSVIIMDPLQAPADDIASGTAYRWVRTRYTLPYDVSDIIELTDIQLGTRVMRVMTNDSFWHNEAWNVVGSPTTFSVIQSRIIPGRWEVWLSSAPVDVRQFRYMYTPRWAQADIEELRTGTVSVSGVTATFSSGILTSSCVGAILRISSSTSIPTSGIGRYDATTKADILNPPASEHIIIQVNSATEAILHAAPPATVTSKAFTVSSHIEMNSEGMRELFFRVLEHQWNIVSRGDRTALMISDSAMRESLKLAMAADARNVQNRTPFRIFSRPVIQGE